MVSPLQNAIQFFRDFGLFDVVLPFLLVFSIMFAILEKTKILGVDKIKDQEIPKRSLNSMVAFVIAMLVVATNKIVSAINQALPNVVLIIISFVAFLLMIGIFMGTGELKLVEKYPKFTMGFIGFSLIALILIVLDSLKLADGQSWMDYILTYTFGNLTGPIVTSAIFLIVVIAAIVYITKTPKPAEPA